MFFTEIPRDLKIYGKTSSLSYSLRKHPGFYCVNTFISTYFSRNEPTPYMKTLFSLLFLIAGLASSAQKHVYDIVLFGNKIGQTVVERIDKGNGVMEYKLNSESKVNALFVKKTSVMNYDIMYRNGQLFSAYVKNVKDGVTEISDILWQGTQYLITKGAEMLHLTQPIDFSAIHLYWTEPKGKSDIFSERLGQYCHFTKTGEGEYVCKLADGVSNIYRYKNGVLYEMEMSKGASVFLRLVP